MKFFILFVVSSLALSTYAANSQTSVITYPITGSFEAISPDQEKFIASKTTCSFDIGNLSTGKILNSYTASQPANDQCSTVYPKPEYAFSPNNKYIFRSDNYTNGALFDVSGKKLFTIPDVNKSLYGTSEFVFSSDSKYIILVGKHLYEVLTFGENFKRIKTLVQVWDISGNKVFEEIHKDVFPNHHFLRHIDINGNNLFFTPDDNTLIVKDFNGKKVMSIRTSNRNDETILGISLSPDSKSVLIRTELNVPNDLSKLYVVNLEGKILRQAEFDSLITQASFSRDGKHVLLSLSNFISNSEYPNKEIKVLDLTGHTILKYDLSKETNSLSKFEISSDNKYLLLGFNSIRPSENKVLLLNMSGEIIHDVSKNSYSEFYYLSGTQFNEDGRAFFVGTSNANIDQFSRLFYTDGTVIHSTTSKYGPEANRITFTAVMKNKFVYVRGNNNVTVVEF